jgi:dolichyl-diphosphooligosaccharide--protein glycosyltransferase
MTKVRAATEELLTEKPDVEEEIEELLAVDADTDTWTYDDISIGSGVFGELVSREIVEKHEGEYRIRDRDGVEQALGLDDDAETSADSAYDRESLSLSLSDIQIDRVAVAGLAGALALVVLFRVLPYGSVFRNGDVVLSGNDPYAYRYLVHQLLAEGGGVFDFSVLSSLPGGVSHGEPLLVTTLWWVSALFGGGSVAGYVLAWYPVVSAVITALLTYVLAVRVSDDKRVGIAAVGLLAVIPAHAFRTGLGFADHHAFDYPWLVLTALAVVVLVGRDIREKRTWGWVLALGVGIGAQTLAWDAGPLLLVPLALYAVAVVPSSLRDGGDPLSEGLPVLAGLVLGALIAGGGHLVLGWHSFEVAVVPALLFVGTAGVFALGRAAKRFETSVRTVVGVEIASVLVGTLVIGVVLPALVERLNNGIDFLFSTGGIAETASLVSGSFGSVAAPLLSFGLALFLAVPYLAWTSWRSYRRHTPAWLALVCYGWYFLALALIQVRFAGQLAIFTGLFAGLGLVHIAAWVDLTDYPAMFAEKADRPPVQDSTEDGDIEWPERREAMYIVGLGVGVGGLGSLLTPAKHGQLLVDDSMYGAARFMREYSEEKGWEYPENYALSRWGRNRVYNWFINGESRNYGYARSNFEDFITSTDSTKWYERLRGRVGFVVVDDQPPDSTGGQTVYQRLRADNFGLETDHYRAVWAAADDSRRVYTLVPGARIVGAAPDRESVSIDGLATVGDDDKAVSTTVSPADDGVYDVRIPLPGEYTVDGWEATVTGSGVRTETVHSPFDGEARWPFEEGSGRWAYDRAGGCHGHIHGAEWTETSRGGSALEFEGKADNYVEMPIESLQEFTISLWAYPTALDVSAENDYRDVVRAEGGSILVLEQTGRLSFRLPGAGGGRLVGSGIREAAWNHVVVTFDGETRTIYIDGEQTVQDAVSIERLDWGGFIRLGNRFSTPSQYGYAGLLDDVRIYDEAVSDVTQFVDQ